MKRIAEYQFNGVTGWGAASTTTRTAFEVEQSDVGITSPHYLGYNHRDYTFTRGDVGRIVERIQHRIPSWSFATWEWVMNALKAQLRNTADHTSKACLEAELERIERNHVDYLCSVKRDPFNDWAIRQD